MSIEIGSTGLQQLRTRREKCDICRYGYAEARLSVGVFAFVGDKIKAQDLLVCGDCALLAYQNIESALERTTTQMKQEPEDDGYRPPTKVELTGPPAINWQSIATGQGPVAA